MRSEERRVGKESRCGWSPYQAEDGIRDGRVTGVQTCALPILDAVELHLRELTQQVRYLLELWPVELDVLPRREVPVALVVLAHDVRQLAQLRRLEQAIRHGDEIGRASCRERE